MLFQQQLQELQKRYEMERQLAILRGQLEEQQQPSMLANIGQGFAKQLGGAAAGMAMGGAGGIFNWLGSGGGYGTTGTGGGNTAAFGPSANFY